MDVHEMLVVLLNYMLLSSKCVGSSSNFLKSNLPAEEQKSVIVFQTLFKRKREEQLDAVKRLQNFKYEEQYRILSAALEKAFEGMVINRAVVENSDYIPGISLPSNDTVRDALYNILDSTTLYGEFQLKLPIIVDRIMKQHPEWLVLIKWAIGFINSTSLLDDKSVELLHLVAQDMGLIERSATFINPYRLEKDRVATVHDVKGQTSKKKKIKTRNNPHFTKMRHTEF